MQSQLASFLLILVNLLHVVHLDAAKSKENSSLVVSGRADPVSKIISSLDMKPCDISCIPVSTVGIKRPSPCMMLSRSFSENDLGDLMGRSLKQVPSLGPKKSSCITTLATEGKRSAFRKPGLNAHRVSGRALSSVSHCAAKTSAPLRDLSDAEMNVEKRSRLGLGNLAGAVGLHGKSKSRLPTIPETSISVDQKSDDNSGALQGTQIIERKLSQLKLDADI